MAKCTPECGSVSKCDIFDFMAKFVGLSVIHPGGYEATRQLLDRLKITKESIIVDIACGKGTSALYIAEKYGCRVKAIDISPELIEAAKHLAQKRGLSGRVDFLVGDAMNLPFDADLFDAAVSQAMLVLVDDKVRTIKEAARVTKRGGTAGWLELSWRSEPSEEFLDHVSNVLCSYCMKRAETYSGWKSTFAKAGISDLNVQEYSFKNGGMLSMLKDEGLVNSLKVAAKYLTNTDVRNRMKLINATFNEYPEYFGYGIYWFAKA
jgi:ubiquinone/menaquinone biosynthesis C-methylase UbiE